MSLVKILLFLLLLRSSLQIIGGKQASVIHWPSYVVIKHITNHYCGGSIFEKFWVITSAQCVDPNFVPELYLEGVGIGIFSLKKSKSGYFIGKDELLIKSHPQFYIDPHGMTKNDIALIRLPNNIKLTNVVPLIKSIQDVESINTCYTAGFGMNNILVYVKNISLEDSFNPERVLFEVEQKIIQLSDCLMILQTMIPSFNRLDDTMHFCATGVREKNGPTFGDFGSPLICGDYQVGIASMSFYNPNISNFIYTIYTRIAPYHIWINNIIKQNSPAATIQMVSGESIPAPDSPEKTNLQQRIDLTNADSNPGFDLAAGEAPRDKNYEPLGLDYDLMEKKRRAQELVYAVKDVKAEAQDKINKLTGNFGHKIKPNLYLIVLVLNKLF